ncbi:MAG TPA: response regulator transcription factor [Candidatus Bathyarchaeia archaeon]|nr:response regulator transcription factor [Candidatus Bathyarchaeia archaeon]
MTSGALGRVVLADDHALVRAGIRKLLGAIAGIEVVGEASDGREALELIASARPDLAVMDIGMSGLNGLDATMRAKKAFPRTRILILSMHRAEEYVLEALRAGASGYLLKEAAPAELELAVRAVLRGEIYLSPGVSSHVAKSAVRQRVTAPVAPSERKPPPALTSRQREVLQLIAEGHSTKDIATRLALSVKTVETHRAQLMERLDIHDVAGLVRYAIRIGLVSSEP